MNISKKFIESLSREAARNALEKSGVNVKSLKEETKKQDPAVLKEQATILLPKSFINKSEAQSQRTKEAHETLYKQYVDSYNKDTSNLVAASKLDSNSASSAWRSLKGDQAYNFNGAKLHELYFGNIGDLTSKISYASLPFMRLQRDFGSFDNWQFDFIACAMAARNGWALCVYEPYTNTYQNVMIDEHNVNIPLGAIPVIVMDVWEHAYYRDYVNDKRMYLNATMKELNWQVIEARMSVAENANLKDLWLIQPIGSSEPTKVITLDHNSNVPPIDDVAGAPPSMPDTVQSRMGSATPPVASTVGPERVPTGVVPPMSGRRS